MCSQLVWSEFAVVAVQHKNGDEQYAREQLFKSSGALVPFVERRSFETACKCRHRMLNGERVFGGKARGRHIGMRSA